LRMRKTPAKSGLDTNPGLARLDSMAKVVGNFIAAHAWIVSGVSVLSVALAIWLYSGLTPHYRLSDMMPLRGEARVVAEDLSASLTGIHPVQVTISWEGDSDLTTLSSRVLPAIAEADSALRDMPFVTNVWSVEMLKSFLVAPEQLNDNSAAARALLSLPKIASERVINLDKNIALVTGFTPDLEAKEIISLKRTLEKRLREIASNRPGVSFTVTGGAILSAVGSLSVINQLHISLMLAVVIVTLVMAVAFRSLTVGVLGLIPNLFAVAATGATIHLLGWGLEYAGIIALTVAFGLAVDDTIHVFNRFRETAYTSSSISENLAVTIKSIGPVLVLTTIVLFLGICASSTSSVPPTRLFGQVFMATVVFALIGDLLMLPALIAIAEKAGFSSLPKNLRSKPDANGRGA